MLLQVLVKTKDAKQCNQNTSLDNVLKLMLDTLLLTNVINMLNVPMAFQKKNYAQTGYYSMTKLVYSMIHANIQLT